MNGPAAASTFMFPSVLPYRPSTIQPEAYGENDVDNNDNDDDNDEANRIQKKKKNNNNKDKKKIKEFQKIMNRPIKDLSSLYEIVLEEVQNVQVIDLHTHLLPPTHVGLCLWGIDELLTYVRTVYTITHLHHFI